MTVAKVNNKYKKVLQYEVRDTIQYFQCILDEMYCVCVGVTNKKLDFFYYD